MWRHALARSSAGHVSALASIRSALEGLLSDRPGIEAATRLLVRFAEDHASEDSPSWHFSWGILVWL